MGENLHIKRSVQGICTKMYQNVFVGRLNEIKYTGK